MHGDYRSLYLAWLHACSLHREWEDFNKDESEPPVPELVNLQNVKGQAKQYQMRQFLKLVEKHNFKLED